MLYLLPVKGPVSSELADYLRRVALRWPVLVVDGSPPDTFAVNARRLAGLEHVPLRADLHCPNGKVAGVRTGFARADSSTVVIADDDVRYDHAALGRMEQLLERADLVVPQNYYDPLPWQARYDTARSLINRALPSGDFPGTLGVRLTPQLRADGYAGDVLFENLQLIRTVRAAGGRVLVARNLFVRRLPPSPRHFLGQRVRQAYDSQAQPARLVVELALLPLALASRRATAGIAAVAVVTAAVGRSRAGGVAHFPAHTALLAPAWVAERAVCSWIALYRRVVLGGIRYGDARLTFAARRWLPSQNGLTAERPHRHSATVRPAASCDPSSSQTVKSPRTTSGPSG